jgi:hypothetical protein
VVRVKVRKPLPTGRQAFRLRARVRVKDLKTNDLAHGQNWHLYLNP